jgi:sulfur-oxidizing protein SoxZ
MHTGVAANPFVSFTTRAVATGDIVFEWREDGGATYTRTVRLVVT